MKTINTYIIERLKLNNDSKIKDEIIGFKEFIKLLQEEKTKWGEFIKNYKIHLYEDHKCYVQPADDSYYYVLKTWPEMGFLLMLEIWCFSPNDIAIEYSTYNDEGDSIQYHTIFNKEDIPDKNWSYTYHKFKVKKSFVKEFVNFLNDIYDMNSKYDIQNRCENFNKECIDKKMFVKQ